jgi:hypothetical protein
VITELTLPMLNFSEIIQTIKSLVETKIDKAKFEIQDQFVGILSRMILLILMGGIMGLALVFLSLTVAFIISQMTQSPYLGFLVVSLVYILILLILFLTRDSSKLQDKVNSLLKSFIFNRSNGDTNEQE